MKEAKRIVSMLPGATEMIYSLNLQDRLVAVTDECDFPEEVRNKPVAVRSSIDLRSLSPSEIDRAVSDALRYGRDLYSIDYDLLRRLSPDLIIGQGLCDVCAMPSSRIGKLISSLDCRPEMLDMSPTTIGGILGNIMELGRITGREDAARALSHKLQSRIAAVHRITRNYGSRKRIFFMEWVDPVYCGGHWVPQMIEIAGGVDSLSRKGRPSVRIPWDDVLSYNPEVLIISSCGRHVSEILKEAEVLTRLPELNSLDAVRSGEVYAVDASSYFARPGPRIVDGIELLAHILNPDLFQWPEPSAYSKIRLSGLLVEEG
jgi:iron complex transport system substrate-binding protein